VSLLLELSKGLFELLKGLQFLVPATLQFARHQTVVWIDGVVLTLCEVALVARLCELLLPLPQQCLLLLSELADHLGRYLELCWRDGLQKHLHDRIVDRLGAHILAGMSCPVLVVVSADVCRLPLVA
jgi:hypothetical protein